MKSKYILLSYALLFIVLLVLNFYEQRSPIYSTRCDEPRFYNLMLNHSEYWVKSHLPDEQRSQIMKQYDFLQIEVLDIETYARATSRSPSLYCIATLKMSPHLPSQQQSFTHLFQQHKTHWQPETQTTTIGFIVGKKSFQIMDNQKLIDTAKLPAQILMEWNASAPTAPQAKPPVAKQAESFTAAEFKALSYKDQMAVLSKEIADLILSLTPAERQAWFKHRDEHVMWRCQLGNVCTVEIFLEQKRVLQNIKKNY